MLRNIVVEADKYVGSKEKVNNSGFIDPKLEKDMKDAGWYPGASWCVYFVKMIWKKVLPSKFPNHWKIAQKLISGNSQNTWSKFKKDTSGLFKQSNTPQIGGIVIWQKYKKGLPLWEGHAGIVKSHTTTSFVTIEGNTNDNGSSNGDGIYEKNRKYAWNTYEGLRLKGFINIIVLKK